MPRKLFFGGFNYQGEVHNFYRYASHETQAKLFMIKQLSKKLGMNFIKLRHYFSEKDNHWVREYKGKK